MIQDIIVWMFFFGAVAFLIASLRKQSSGSSVCAPNCKACGKIDFKQMENKIKTDSKLNQ